MKKFFIFSAFFLLTSSLFSQVGLLINNAITTNIVIITNEITNEITNGICLTNYIEETNFVTNFVIVTNVIFLTNDITSPLKEVIIETNVVSSPVKTEKYTIQAGIFLNKKLADKLITKLRNKGFIGYIAEKYPFYKVLVGKNLSKNEAKNIQKKLKSYSFPSIIKLME